MEKLTRRQANFVNEYLKDLNGTQAAIRAGYSLHTAAAISSENLQKPSIVAAIDAAMLARSERVKVDADYVLKRLHDEVEADIAEIYDEDGSLLPVHEWPAVFRKGLIEQIETEELFEGAGKERVQVGVVRKVKLSPRIKRLELIGKHIGVNAFQDVVEVKGLSSLAERMERAAARTSAASEGSDE